MDLSLEKVSKITCGALTKNGIYTFVLRATMWTALLDCHNVDSAERGLMLFSLNANFEGCVTRKYFSQRRYSK